MHVRIDNCSTLKHADITQCTSLMSTWMVAFLLLFKHREVCVFSLKMVTLTFISTFRPSVQGVSLSVLIESYKWLEHKATSSGRLVCVLASLGALSK